MRHKYIGLTTPEHSGWIRQQHELHRSSSLILLELFQCSVVRKQLAIRLKTMSLTIHNIGIFFFPNYSNYFFFKEPQLCFFLNYFSPNPSTKNLNMSLGHLFFEAVSLQALRAFAVVATGAACAAARVGRPKNKLANRWMFKVTFLYGSQVSNKPSCLRWFVFLTFPSTNFNGVLMFFPGVWKANPSKDQTWCYSWET